MREIIIKQRKTHQIATYTKWFDLNGIIMELIAQMVINSK